MHVYLLFNDVKHSVCMSDRGGVGGDHGTVATVAQARKLAHVE